MRAKTAERTLNRMQTIYEEEMANLEISPDLNDDQGRSYFAFEGNKRLRKLLRNRSRISYCDGFFYGYAVALSLKGKL